MSHYNNDNNDDDNDNNGSLVVVAMMLFSFSGRQLLRVGLCARAIIRSSLSPLATVDDVALLKYFRAHRDSRSCPVSRTALLLRMHPGKERKEKEVTSGHRRPMLRSPKTRAFLQRKLQTTIISLISRKAFYGRVLASENYRHVDVHQDASWMQTGTFVYRANPPISFRNIFLFFINLTLL